MKRVAATVLLLLALWPAGLHAQADSSATTAAATDSVTLTKPRRNPWYLNAPTLHRRRLTGVSVGTAAGYSLSMAGLGVAWYGQNGLSGWRWFNDNHEWQQMDKLGHAMGGYMESVLLMKGLRWSGVPRGRSILFGCLSGFVMMSSFEIFDGFSPEYGASWGDLLANASGSLLAAGNELIFRDQVVRLKFAYLPSEYAARRPDLLGSGLSQVIKDYNGMTFWLSIRPHAFIPNGKVKNVFPRWLCLAVGYGANGLLGGYGTDPQSVIDAREYRQWYLSLDIDWEQIPTRRSGLKMLFTFLNFIKLPFPAVEFSRYGTTFQPLMF